MKTITIRFNDNGIDMSFTGNPKRAELVGVLELAKNTLVEGQVINTVDLSKKVVTMKKENGKK